MCRKHTRLLIFSAATIANSGVAVIGCKLVMKNERFTAAPMPPSAQRSAEKTMVALVIALLFYLAATAFPVPI